MSEQPLYLGLLETAGNQAYIFATNRLRENVGASQRVWEAGVEFTYRAAKEVTGCERFDTLCEAAGQGPECYAKAMKDAPQLNGDSVAIEVVLATSGKALFLARERGKAEDLITAATLMALDEAPGLTLRGAIVEIEGSNAIAANAAVKRVHEAIDAIRDRLPAPEIRFPTLPILEPCASSGLPAAEIPSKETYGSDPKPSSDVTIAKRTAYNAAVKRISKLIVGRAPEGLGKNIGEMEKQIDWIGIVHADGNGMGQLFMDLGELCKIDGKTTLASYFNAYRSLSLSLDLCGVAAFHAALKEIYPLVEPATGEGNRSGRPDAKRLPLLPLVLGGDDLTLLCDGRIATRFAAVYLREFRKQTEKCKVLGHSSSIPAILESKRRLEERRRTENRNTTGKDDHPGSRDWTGLGAAAGIAITKPHYPFHRGYELAERLLKEAKTAKTKLGVSRCSLDFHVLFDGAETSLDDLRERWKLPTGHRLTARPYVLGEEGDDKNDWARYRKWEDLMKAAIGLAGAGEGDEEDTLPRLPRSQQYALRAALFRGAVAADRQLALIRHRYEKFGWETVVPGTGPHSPPQSLFFPIEGHSAEEGSGANLACRLLDALELADLGAGGAK